MLRPHVVEYICKVVCRSLASLVTCARFNAILQSLLHNIAVKCRELHGPPAFLHAHCLYAFTIAQTLDLLLDHPPFGHHPGTREEFLGRLRSAMSLANTDRKFGDAIDCFLPVESASMPRVPPWTNQEIQALLVKEATDPWTCVNALLEDGMASSGGLNHLLAKAAEQDAMGYGRHPSGPRFV